jgi:hypothetical protein
MAPLVPNVTQLAVLAAPRPCARWQDRRPVHARTIEPPSSRLSPA